MCARVGMTDRPKRKKHGIILPPIQTSLLWSPLGFGTAVESVKGVGAEGKEHGLHGVWETLTCQRSNRGGVVGVSVGLAHILGKWYYRY